LYDGMMIDTEPERQRFNVKNLRHFVYVIKTFTSQLFSIDNKSICVFIATATHFDLKPTACVNDRLGSEVSNSTVYKA